MSDSGKSSVLLVDDHPVMRLGLRLALQSSPRFAVAGEASDAVGAREAVERLRPDLVVFDLVLGGRDGLELLEDLCAVHPGGRVLVYSSQSEKMFALRAVEAGARGYLMKSAGPPEVVAALEQIATGEIVVSPAIQQLLLARTASRPAADTPLGALSARELQILRLIAAGQSPAEIAAELRLSVKTIGTYRERLKDKLGCESARELDRRAEEFLRA
jgi:DNA-binding NarL/FixJ family response regulator